MRVRETHHTAKGPRPAGSGLRPSGVFEMLALSPRLHMLCHLPNLPSVWLAYAGPTAGDHIKGRSRRKDRSRLRAKGSGTAETLPAAPAERGGAVVVVGCVKRTTRRKVQGPRLRLRTLSV